jgi:hypothetical protein
MNNNKMPGIVAHPYKEAKARGSQVQGQPQLYSKTLPQKRKVLNFK